MKTLKSFCAIFCLVNHSFGSSMEPNCYSRFDYDEKMLMKLLKIEDQIKKFEDFLTEMKETLTAEKSDRVESFENEMDEFKKRNIEEIQRQQNLTESIRESQERMNTTIGELIKYQQSLIKEALNEVNERVNTYKKFTEDKDVAFTVTSPGGGRTSDSLTFSNVITNEGDGYDISTGMFTCPVRGLYYFSLHLMKQYGSSADQVGCYIKRDGTNIVRAHFNQNEEHGSYGVSTSVYVKLEKGDLVTVAGCHIYGWGVSSFRYLESWSSFSGHLIKSYF